MAETIRFMAQARGVHGVGGHRRGNNRPTCSARGVRGVSGTADDEELLELIALGAIPGFGPRRQVRSVRRASGARP